MMGFAGVRSDFRFSARVGSLFEGRFGPNQTRRMPNLPRIQFPGAIYHVFNRGNACKTVLRDNGHYERITRGLVGQKQQLTVND